MPVLRFVITKNGTELWHVPGEEIKCEVLSHRSWVRVTPSELADLFCGRFHDQHLLRFCKRPAFPAEVAEMLRSSPTQSETKEEPVLLCDPSAPVEDEESVDPLPFANARGIGDLPWGTISQDEPDQTVPKTPSPESEGSWLETKLVEALTTHLHAFFGKDLKKSFITILTTGIVSLVASMAGLILNICHSNKNSTTWANIALYATIFASQVVQIAVECALVPKSFNPTRS